MAPDGLPLVGPTSLVFGVFVPFPFGVLGRMWNSFTLVPDHSFSSSMIKEKTTKGHKDIHSNTHIPSNVF